MFIIQSEVAGKQMGNCQCKKVTNHLCHEISGFLRYETSSILLRGIRVVLVTNCTNLEWSENKGRLSAIST